jgi:ABC-2 type transport system permease protein
MSLRPYLAGFRLALSQELIHRSNFLVGKMREFIFFGALLLLFQQLPHGVGHWSQPQLLTYILLAAFLSAQLGTLGMNTIASEIADGDLVNFLLRPINYLGYCLARISAARLLSLIGGILSVGILVLIFPSLHVSLLSSTHSLLTTLYAILLTVGSLILVQLIDFIAGLLAFWTDRAYGPRFLTFILIQFCSGAYLPIDTLPTPVQTLLHATPFPSLIFAPVSTFIEGVTAQTFSALQIQWMWIVALSLCLTVLWKRGLKSYAAYGK